MKWTKSAVRNLMVAHDHAVERGVLAIYARQTTDEQSAETTKHENGRGFTHSDARQMSYYAKWLLSGKRLTGKYLDDARNRMMKYAGQLLEVIEQSENEKTKNAI